MKRLIAFFTLLVLFLFSLPPAYSDAASGQIVVYRMKEGGMKESRDQFSTDERIHAEFTFLPEAQETGVEFRWFNPLNLKKQTDFELVKSPMLPRKVTVKFWMFLPARVFHRIVGSRNFGRWRLEIWVNGRRVAEKFFDVGIGS
jgi:hypothetical protein